MRRESARRVLEAEVELRGERREARREKGEARSEKTQSVLVLYLDRETASSSSPHRSGRKLRSMVVDLVMIH